MRPSVGLIAEVALPTGSAGLRGSGFRPSVELPVEWDLGHDWSLGVMPGVVRDSDFTYGVFAASVALSWAILWCPLEHLQAGHSWGLWAFCGAWCLAAPLAGWSLSLLTSGASSEGPTSVV